MIVEQKQGFGDAVEKVIQELRLDKLLKIAGVKQCGCRKRKEYLNKLFKK